MKAEIFPRMSGLNAFILSMKRKNIVESIKVDFKTLKDMVVDGVDKETIITMMECISKKIDIVG